MLAHVALDVRAALSRAECDLYSNLVTRATGRAVRSQLELILGELAGRRLAVLDFSRVGVLDFSCADEIVAQLLLRHGAGRRVPVMHGAPASWFLCRGLHEAHLEALDPVLEHHELALVAETQDGVTHLLGVACDDERAAWSLVHESGGGAADALAAHGARELPALEPWLAVLAQRRLVVDAEGGYWPLRFG
ncbi:MAG: hypothetical protein MUF21_09850 [Gemmatimonadaceae bacterium]|jgi:hypothetical protein|nr:hypothetical protein [Gemmatimonadaceae bacterium]